MKSAIKTLLIAALASSDAVMAESGPKWGDNGMGSPFEQFRNPNVDDEPSEVDHGSHHAPIEPADIESLPEEEKFQFDAVMTAEEEACYLDRYTDVTNMTANEHYARVGEIQGRNIRCQYLMTGIAAKRYLRRYAELGNAFGRDGKGSFKKAREHWYNNGSKQHPPLSLRISYEPENPYKCSDYGGECMCPGRIHFGHKFRLDNHEEITTLPVLLDFNKKTKWEEGYQLHITCDRHHFAKGKKWSNFTDEELQCFCEPFLTPEPYHCADDGQNCECKNGNVFYGEKFVHHGETQIATFQEMLDDGEYLVAAQIHNSIHCEPASFVGHEIFEEYGENGCYCDDIGAVDITYIHSEIEWWTSRIEEIRIQEMNARAEAEAEAIRMQAAHDNALLRQEMAEMEARMKQAEADYAHAQEEAHAKAAERAAADKAEAEAEAKEEAEKEKQLAADRAAREKEHEDALAAAEAAATAAAKEHAAAARRKLLEAAEKAKQEAIKKQVAATIAAQQERAAVLLAQQKAKHEADKRAQEAAMAEARRLQEAENKRRIAIEEAKKQQMVAAMQAAHEDELAAQAEAAKAAAQKKLAQALEDQMNAYEAKMAAEAAERARLEKLKQEEEARKLAAKLAAEKAAEEAKRKAEEEERLRKAAELAAHRQLIEDEKAAAAEEARLAQEAQDQEAARAAAQQAAQKAAADLALAKSEADKQRAMAAQSAAEEAQRIAQAAERASLLKKQHLEEEIRKKRLVAELAAKAAREAEEKKLAAQAAAADWKRQAEEAEAESKRQQAAAAAALEAKKAQLEAERQRQVAKHDAALKVQAETYRLASLAADEAHRAAEAARRAKEEEQIAAHKRQMSARRDAFEKAFRNVWATGDTGVSLIHLTVPGHSDELVGRLFKDTLIADVADVKTEVKKSWNSRGSYKYDVLRHKLVMISSDDRIAEVIEETALFMAKFNEPIPFDLVVTPLATGSKEYIEWVKLQTLKKDDDAAFFNVQAESEIKALENRVPDTINV